MDIEKVEQTRVTRVVCNIIPNSVFYVIPNNVIPGSDVIPGLTRDLGGEIAGRGPQ